MTKNVGSLKERLEKLLQSISDKKKEFRRGDLEYKITTSIENSIKELPKKTGLTKEQILILDKAERHFHSFFAELDFPKAEVCQNLADQAWKRFDSRRGIEYKVAIALWTSLAGASALVITTQNWNPFWSFPIIILVIMAWLQYWSFLYYLSEAFHMDHLNSYFWERMQQKYSGTSKDYCSAIRPHERLSIKRRKNHVCFSEAIKYNNYKFAWAIIWRNIFCFINDSICDFKKIFFAEKDDSDSKTYWPFTDSSETIIDHSKVRIGYGNKLHGAQRIQFRITIVFGTFLILAVLFK